MFRSSSPSGRARRILTIAALLCSVVLGAPAQGQTPSEAPSAPAATVPASVTGLDPLVVTAGGAGLRLDMTDAAGNTAWWHLDAQPQPGVYEVDLGQPDGGVAPVNGAAAAELSAAGVPVLSAAVLLDRDPVAPVLTALGSVGRTALAWEPVSGPGPVQYRVERAAAGGAWTVLRSATSGTSYLDTDLAAGRYRYRVTAAVSAALGGVNRSTPAVASVRVAPVEPAAPTEEPTAGSPSPPPAPTAVIPDLPPAPQQRRVAAAGDIRRGITVGPEQGRPVRRRRTTSNLPALATRLRLPREALAPRIAAPQMAAPTPPPPDIARRGIQPLPVPVAPAGMLAVEAAARADLPVPQSTVTMVSAALLAALFILLRRRREDPLSLAPDGLR